MSAVSEHAHIPKNTFGKPDARSCVFACIDLLMHVRCIKMGSRRSERQVAQYARFNRPDTVDEHCLCHIGATNAAEMLA